MILIRASSVHHVRDDLIAVEVRCQPLSFEDHETLERLFPNTERQVSQLLEREALLANIAPTESYDHQTLLWSVNPKPVKACK